MRRRATLWGLGLVGLVSVWGAGCREQAETGPAQVGVASATPEAAEPAALAVGDPAPDIAFTLQDGNQVRLRSLAGQPIVVYFYPKDDTRGCTLEAQGIRDDYAAFEKAKARVFGVSTQDAASHQAFIDKHELPFDLVVDADGSVAKAFGVPLRGGVALRQTFLIDPRGTIKKVWREVDPARHSAELLRAIAE